MKRRIANNFLAALLIISFPALSHAGGHFMGSNETIATDGAFDVTRNPALLLEQQSRNSIGVLGIYVPSSRIDLVSTQYTKPTTAPFSIINSTELLTTLKSFTLYSGAASISYIRTMRNFAFGVNLQYDGERSRLSGIATNVLSLGIIATTIGTVQYTTKINTSLTLSAALRIAKHGVIGIQVKEAYSETGNDQRSQGPTLAPSVLKSTAYTNTREVTTTPAIGYLHHLGYTQLGAYVKLGDLSFRDSTTKFSSYEKRLNGPLTALRGEKNIPFDFDYRSAPTFMLGVYTRPVGVFGFSVGADISLPCIYRNRSASYISEVFRYYLFNQRMYKGAGATVKGGLELHPTRWFTMSLGIAYNYSVSKSQFIRFYSVYITHSTTDTGFLGANGFLEYQFSETVRAAAGITYLRGRFSTDSFNYNESNVSTIKPTQIITTLAVSTGF